MSQLIIQLVFALLAFYYAISSCRILGDRVKSALNKLDNLSSGDYGYFSNLQRYYDNRKLLVICYLLSLSLSFILVYVIKGIISLLIS